MRIKYCGCIAVLFIGTVLSGCSSTSTISMQVQKPAAIHLSGVKKIAVVDFQGVNRSGSQTASILQSMLMETRHFDLMERDKLKNMMDEQNLGMSGVVDDATAVQVGKVLGVDAMIIGEVTTYEVEADEHGVEKVERKEGTGRYEMVDEKNIFTGKTKKVKREIMKTVLVDQHYKIRRGTVAINFRVVDVETGQLMAVHSDSKSYSSDKVVEGSWQTLKPEGEILSELSKTICRNFVRLIAPYFETEKRIIESGKANIQVGKKYAQAGLWPEALEAWKKAVVEMPREPAAFYDIGLAYEVQGDLDQAEKAYKIAVGLKQKKLYLDAVARIRKAKEDQRRLQEQLMDRGKEVVE